MKTVAIVGRPNVGKSTLFNRLTHTKDALVIDLPGVTRDRQYGHVHLDEHEYTLIDTGGIGCFGSDDLADEVVAQTNYAIAEADIIMLVVDARAGLTAADQDIANQLRGCQKPLFVVVNKSEGLQTGMACADFYQLGFENLFAIAAQHNSGLEDLREALIAACPSPKALPITLEEGEELAEFAEDTPIKVAIVGRPNAGKSTLINRILGNERVIVSDLAGTTRDSLYIPFTHQAQEYVLIDTAGIRRRSRVDEIVEKFSVIKTLKAIEDSHVVVMLINAQEGGVVDQDLHLLGYILEAGKSLVIAVNKWDNLEEYDRERIKSDIERKLQFVSFAKIKMISALHGTAVGELYPLIKKAYRSAFVGLQTAELNNLLAEITGRRPVPLAGKGRIKFRYAHLGGHNPPTIVIHGSNVDRVPKHYERYLMNTFREKLRLEGTPLVIKFVNS